MGVDTIATFLLGKRDRPSGREFDGVAFRIFQHHPVYFVEDQDADRVTRKARWGLTARQDESPRIAFLLENRV